MDYSNTQQGQNLAAAAAVAAQHSLSPAQPRTFDGIAEAVRRVASINAGVEAMLDRIQPTPRDTASGNAVGQSLHQPHAIAISDLHAQLDFLGSQLERLEKHI